MKQFSLEEYLKNPSRKVVTRDGRSARIICADFNNKNYPVIVEVEGMEGPVSVTREGRHMSSSIDNNLDIFFDSKKYEGWINIYRNADGIIWLSPYYESKEEAEKEGKCYTCSVTTIKIEWEE